MSVKGKARGGILKRAGKRIRNLLGMGLAGCLLTACGSSASAPEPVIPTDTAEDTAVIELTALVSSREEAEKTATLYGIELQSFSDGVAVYSTDKDLGELNRLGEANGFPLLTPNREKKLYE